MHHDARDRHIAGEAACCSLLAAAMATVSSMASLERKVDFVEARRRVEVCRDHPATVRARAFATYVGLFDFVDDDGVVRRSLDDLTGHFEMNRNSWGRYCDVLIEAGLLERLERQGRHFPVRLLIPS